MTILNLSEPVFYKAGDAGVSAVAGYESHANRVVRYSFTSPEGGASAVRLAFSGNHKGNGTTPAPLAFYIGTDPDSHSDGGVDSEKTGVLTALTDGTSYSGTADLVLLPDTTYYVWVFPNTTAFGWMTWSRSEGAAVISLDGAATSLLTVSDGTLGQPLALQVTRYADLSHTVTCTFRGETVTVAADSRETQLTWTPPLALAERCTDADHAMAEYTVETFRDGVSIGRRTATARLFVPDSCVPTVSFTWENTAVHQEFFQPLVQQVSILEVTPQAEGSYGSTVRSVAVTLNGKPFKDGFIEDSGEVALTVTATDSRGRSASRTEMLTVLPYTYPKVTLTAIRVDENGDLDDMGEFAKLTVSCTYTPLDTGYFPMVGVGLAGEQLPMQELTGDTYTVILPAPSTEAPEYWAVCIDNILAPGEATAKLSIGYATLDVLAGGKGIAFGTTATKEGFHCAMPAFFTGGIGGDIADYVTGAEQKTPGFTVRTWNTGDTRHTAPRRFFNGEDNTLLQWAGEMMANGFDGVAHFQLGHGATPAEYCMGLLVSNGIDRANLLVLAQNGLYCTVNNDGFWYDWKLLGTPTAAADTVVETGSADGWTWRKWASGCCELDGKKDAVSFSSLSQSGNIYYAQTGAWTFPFPLTEVNTATFGFLSTAGNVFMWGEKVSTTGIGNSFIGRGNSAAVAGTPSVHITGKWR